MRQGSVFKRCTGCGRKVADRRCANCGGKIADRRCANCGGKIADRRCANCGGDRYSWAYTVDVAPSGAPRKQRMKAGFARKADALAAMNTLQGDVRDGTYMQRDEKLTAGRYMTTWLDGQRAQLKPSTHDGYSRCWAYLKPRIGDVRLQALDGPTLTKVYAELAAAGGRDGRPLALRTVRYCHAVLRKALNDAVKQGKIARNAALLAELPRRAQRQDPLATPDETDERLHVWTAEQVRAFVEHRKAAGDPLWPLYVVTVGCGLRRGEALGLRWGDVDLEGAVIRVRQAVTVVNGKVRLESPKTVKSKRPISVDPVVVAALRHRRRAQLREIENAGARWQDFGLVFSRQDGRPQDPNHVTRRFARAIAAVNTSDEDVGRPVRAAEPVLPRIRLHDLRHTYATLALSAGVPLHVVSKRMGHSAIGITHDVYSHWVPQTDEQAASVFHTHVWAVSGGP